MLTLIQTLTIITSVFITKNAEIMGPLNLTRRVALILFSFAFLFTCPLVPLAAEAQTSDATRAATEQFADNSAEFAGNLSGLKRLTSNYEFWLSILVLIFSVFVILLQYRLVTRSGSEFKPDLVLRMTLITPIIMGTVFFVTAGFDSQQIAPAMGLFGTIAGYILGKESSRPSATKEANKEADNEAKVTANDQNS
jgi:hypothetical protein